jgi:polyisoprenoid-binding protein YceI
MIVDLPRLLLAISLCLFAGTADARDWAVQPDASMLGFTASAQGEVFDGRFTRFEPRIRFDPDALDDSRFEVAIALDSVDSRNSERDEALAEREFFDSVRRPDAHYTATRFIALDDGRFRADGRLSLRGIEHPVALTFRWEQADGHATLDGEATLDRLDFEVGSGDWADPAMIAREVSVHTRLKLQAAD